MKQVYFILFLTSAFMQSGAIVALTGCEDTPLFSLIQEVKKNCSITEGVSLHHGPYYGSWYKPALFEEALLGCPLCGSLVKFLLPSLKNYGGEHIVEGHCNHEPKEPVAQLLEIASLYHEMGHIAHQDGFHDEKMKGRLFVNSELAASRYEIPRIYKYGHLRLFGHIPHEKLEKQLCDILVKEKGFSADVQTFSRYTERGRRFLTEGITGKSALESSLLAVFDQSLEKWEKPFCDTCRSTVGYKRGKERRADLFALNKLWENGRLDVIIAYLYMHAFSDFIFATDYDVHPSGIERALCILGFLSEKGIDIPPTIAEFERKFLAEIRKHNREYVIRHLGPELMLEHRQHHA